MTKAIVAAIHFYQLVSRACAACGFNLPISSGCRQWPTCSEYAITAVQERGVVRGSFRAVIRVLRCNPLSHRYVH